MPSCEYLIYAGKYSKLQDYAPVPALEPCGKEGKIYSIPENKLTKRLTGKKNSICLCEEHKEFVFDCYNQPERIK